ncbi:MAG: nuclear transport factor 2 family protein [Planctomycetota bacterium]
MSSSLTDDSSRIKTLLEGPYFRGMDEVSFEVFEPCFHPEARLAFIQDGELVMLSLSEWRARLEAIRSDPSHPILQETSRKEVETVRVDGDVASAVVSFRFTSRAYVDHLHLTRCQGEWRILSKTFHLELG